MNALSIESAPGQPFLAQLPIDQAHPNADISCFTLQQPPATDPIQLEYTTLGSQQGVLMLWSNNAITGPLRLTLIDRCLHHSQTFTIQADNTVTTPASAVTALTAPEVTSTETPVQTPSPAQPAILAEPATASPVIPAEAYDALQQQINALQTDFKQLQKKSDILYASNLAQASILTSMKQQLTQLQNENHLLRTLVLTLSLALIITGYFFADWLRRHAAVPKTPKVREKAKAPGSQSQPGNTQPPHSHAPTQHPSAIPTGNHQAPHTQSPYQPAAGRLQPVPMHANDDAVSLSSAPQKVSSQQSTNAVMQDASRLFTHGRINQAIEHLQQHLYRHPKSSPWMWLYLLDLLSKEGKQQDFDIVAADCRKHFNLSVERNPDFKQQGIESYPRIMKALQQTWGTPQVISLIDDLVYNTRLVPRMGFERCIFEELMMLKEIACQTQNLPTSQPSVKPSAEADSMQDNLRELQKLSGDIYVLAPVDQTPFQYWTDFTFELDAPATVRKSA
ncbi:MAG: type IV pilus assembly protein FimV [Methylophilus sp.]|uniref:type IV pilus assembly protein FimV n=1 Tax=Methylophilus sp. TaxID=29541 RepID=UPI003FA13356